jgi:hypothetical protein
MTERGERLRRAAPWILILTVSTAADWLVRIRTGFEMQRVFAGEALIFPASALALGILRWRIPASGRKTRALQTTLIWMFALAGLRSAMLALGSSYLWAIIAPLSLATFGLWTWWKRRRESSSLELPASGEDRNE